MRKILGSVLVAAIAVASPAVAVAQPAPAAQGDEAAKLAEAHAIIEVIFPPAEREAMLTKLQSDVVKQFSTIIPASILADPGMKKIFEDFEGDALAKQRAVAVRHLPAQMDAMAIAYAREFSLAELKDIHAFASTHSGSHYLSKSTAIIGDPAVAKANTDTIREINGVTQELLPGFQEKVIAYLKAHPDVAAKIEAADKAK